MSRSKISLLCFFYLILPLVMYSGCSSTFSPFSGERGAILLLFPFLWWPLKFFLYAKFIRHAEKTLSTGKLYGLSLARIAVGVVGTLVAVQLFKGGPFLVVMFPLVSVLSWTLVYYLLDKAAVTVSRTYFLTRGFLLSLALNLIALAVTGIVGFGC